MDCANVAATLHRQLVDDNSHGYDQINRCGDGTGYTVNVDGQAYRLAGGDRDCSSSVIECWQQALVGTDYEGALDAATYTGNMRSVFVGSGLFTAEPMSFTAQRGDIYLSDEHHTAMCQSPDPDLLSEFYINEQGGIYYGQTGDQTGNEGRLHSYYDFPWDCILHYNGKADEDDMTPEDVWNFEQNGVKVRDRLQGTDTAANAAPQKVWEQEIQGVQARDRLYGMDAIQLPALQAQVAALSAAVEAMAKSIGADPDKIADAVVQGVKDKLESLEIKMSVG